LDAEPIRLYEPFGFFDFVALERHARCVLTDSGTVQEECCIMGVPTVTVRDTTERPETVECGSNLLSGLDPDAICRCVELSLDSPASWEAPAEYLIGDVSATVANIVLGHRLHPASAKSAAPAEAGEGATVAP
jgi:UDP-N-acetylglucosamine 2-epimerase (non-hydrolysing)